MIAAEPCVKRQTIKQAKADFKARGRPTISDVEKKQIERAAQLERRAWRAKEQSKSKSEWLRKKTERQQQEREAQQRLQMATQRRCDRFGHKSSQLHLGKFFGGVVGRSLPANGNAMEVEQLRDDVDDETLLEALEVPIVSISADEVQRRAHQTDTKYFTSPTPNSALLSCGQIAQYQEGADYEGFWTELVTSTQIARELAAEPNDAHGKTALKSTSFSSGDFDLTVEEIEELHPMLAAPGKAYLDKQLVPPPALPLPKSITFRHKTSSVDHTTKRSVMDSCSGTQHPVSGFTIAELESFVDDDLQLTQLPGG